MEATETLPNLQTGATSGARRSELPEIRNLFRYLRLVLPLGVGLIPPVI